MVEHRFACTKCGKEVRLIRGRDARGAEYRPVFLCDDDEHRWPERIYRDDLLNPVCHTTKEDHDGRP